MNTKLKGDRLGDEKYRSAHYCLEEYILPYMFYNSAFTFLGVAGIIILYVVPEN